MRSQAKPEIAMKRPRFKVARSTSVREIFLAAATILFPLGLAAQAEPQQEIKHFQYSDLDRFRAVAKSILHRHVLTYGVIGIEQQPGPGPSKIRYPQTEQEFTELQSKGDYRVITS